MMKISKIRGFLYNSAKVFGDVQAFQNGKVGQRIGRRLVGKITGRLIGKIFR